MLNTKDLWTNGFGAVEQPDGSYITEYGDIKWFNKDGEVHREDGPAAVYFDGLDTAKGHIWWLNGNNYSFDEWLIKSNTSDEVKMMLRLQYD